jgi:hypothetical protein
VVVGGRSMVWSTPDHRRPQIFRQVGSGWLQQSGGRCRSSGVLCKNGHIYIGRLWSLEGWKTTMIYINFKILSQMLMKRNWRGIYLVKFSYHEWYNSNLNTSYTKIYILISVEINFINRSWIHTLSNMFHLKLIAS